MSNEPLPVTLQEFLAKHVDTIAQLEALLLLRATPGVAWTGQSTAKRLYIGEQEALQTLSHLAGHEFLERDTAGYRYAPRSEELARMADVAAEYHKSHLIPITNLIHSKPRRIREFADAFKLKKD